MIDKPWELRRISDDSLIGKWETLTQVLFNLYTSINVPLIEESTLYYLGTEVATGHDLNDFFRRTL